MAMDNITIQILTDRIAEQLIGSQFGKPLALGGFDYAFPYSEVLKDGSIRHGTFLFSLDPTMPLVGYSHDRYEKVEDMSPFFNSLKKLTMSTVTAVKKMKGERIITISLRANPNDISEINTGYDFILELFPNHPNAYIVAYPYGKIISLYREKTNLEKGVFIARNTYYSYPPERDVLPDHPLDMEAIKPFVNTSLFRLIEADVNSGRHTLDELIALIKNSHDIYLRGKEILPYHFDQPDIVRVEPEKMYHYFVADQKKKAKLAKEKELISLIEHAVKVNEKKIRNLKHDQEAARKHLVYLEYGQEIYLYQGEIHYGDTLLERDGYRIPLNPDLDAPANANRYFKLYRKAKTAITILDDLIVKAADEGEYLLKKEMETKDGTPRDILELKSELLEEGYIHERQNRKGPIRHVNKRRTYDPHYIKLENGLIGFGMNGLQNETLTFDIAKKDDLFFHVKDFPGSHVVVLEGQEDEEVCRLAEELCLYLSHLDNGEVMIARRKNVKKNPNKTGLVSILKYETVAVKFIREASVALFKKTLKA